MNVGQYIEGSMGRVFAIEILTISWQSQIWNPWDLYFMIWVVVCFPSLFWPLPAGTVTDQLKSPDWLHSLFWIFKSYISSVENPTCNQSSISEACISYEPQCESIHPSVYFTTSLVNLLRSLQACVILRRPTEHKMPQRPKEAKCYDELCQIACSV